MPTLQELTLAHSQRLSDIYRARDVRLAEAQASRDLQLRAVPAAAKIYDQYDDELAEAREKQLATEAKAEAARNAALMTAIDRRSDELEDAHMARRSADVEAVRNKRRMEDAAEAKYLAALSRARELPEKERAKFLQDADRDRREELAQARRTHDQALAAAQHTYRETIDEAIIRERRDGRDGERAYLETLRLGEAAARASQSAADQALLGALVKLPGTQELVRGWRAQLARIRQDTADAEREEFARFRQELEAIKV